MLITPIKPIQDDLSEDQSSASNTISSQSSNDTTAPSESYHSDEGSSSSSSSSPVNSPKTPPSSSDCSLSLPSDNSSDSMSRDEDLPGLIMRVMTKGKKHCDIVLRSTFVNVFSGNSFQPNDVAWRCRWGVLQTILDAPGGHSLSWGNLQVYIGVGSGLIVNEIEVKIVTILGCNQ